MHFLRRYAAREHSSMSSISDEAREALMSYSWPGNVRELENAIERAVVLGCSDRIVADDLPEPMLDASAALPGGEKAPYHQTVLETKRRLILDAIDRAGGNFTAAARLLGINPTYLHRLLRNLRLRDTTAAD
jgi:DNA-binding NtrC family response regulator